MCYFAIVFVDFTLKNFSGLLHFIDVSAAYLADEDKNRGFED